MSTLPRFRLPDESSSRDVNSVARSGAWSDFDDLDALETRVQVKELTPSNEFDVMPTQVRPQLGRVARGGNATAANVDDVVEELRAAAAGRSSKVRELTSTDLLEDIPDADDAQEVDVSELVFDRVVRPREVWNVRQAARPTQVTILGPTTAGKTRFVATAALAMFLGAALAVAAAFLVWRLTGLSF